MQVSVVVGLCSLKAIDAVVGAADRLGELRRSPFYPPAMRRNDRDPCIGLARVDAEIHTEPLMRAEVVEVSVLVGHSGLPNRSDNT